MNQQAFSDMLDKVLAMFGRTPTGAMRGVCWDVCENLPDVFADYAVEQARDLDRQPGNLSKFFRDSWFRWRESHPAMAAKEQEFGCDFCHKGLIYFVKQEEGEGWSLEVAVCGHCRPGGQTQANIRQHETKGFWEDDARVKWKVAAEQFWWFRFFAARLVKGSWEVEEYRG